MFSLCVLDLTYVLYSMHETIILRYTPKFSMINIINLVSACHDMDQWPNPVPGETVNLPIMGSVIQVHVHLKNWCSLDHV